MNRRTPVAIGQLAFLCIILFVLATPAVAQKPTQAQINAIRQACRADYQTYCSSVPTGGAAALTCLQENAQSLSRPCQRAVSSVGSAGPPAQSQRPAAVPVTPPATATQSPPPAMSPRQESILLRRSCGSDFRAYCRDVPPGGGRIIACLEANGTTLSRPCRSALISARQGR